mmetsp:Transcript_47349/g.107429  ORF Transcript_47349/g.107429 Transcript_47349/m.107429 type:complete len:171 (-) Transcript_47349:92-604(-)
MNLALYTTIVWVAASSAVCPGSPSSVHASCQIKAEVDGPCKAVRQEVLARLGAQASGAWHDPHNNGTYTYNSALPDGGLVLSRTSPTGAYTDKLGLSFTAASNTTCVVAGCSESQVFSIMDFSTNYCNLRMLYCGSVEGCRPVAHDLGVRELSVSPSWGAGSDPAACLKV